MNIRHIRYWDDWRDLKNEAVIEEEIDEEGVDFDHSCEGNEIEFD
jgi:hypothetical protein